MAGAAWPSVGRQSEIDQVDRAIADERVRAVVVAGDLGVGKTHLATTCVSSAADLGAPTARALATRSAATISFGALASLLPGLDASAGASAVRRSVGALEARLGRSGRRRGILMVDDAQLLDDASATVVHQLATSTDVFVLATLRVGEDCPDPITALWKDGLAERIDLGPLDRPAFEELVSDLLGGVVDGRTVHRLWVRTGGNPLFLRELTLGAIGAGVLDDCDGVWRLRADLAPTARLAELVGARLQDLDSAARAALEVVALGEPLRLDVLAALTDLGHVAALEQRGLVTIDAAARHEDREVRLGHPLHGEVLRAGMATLRSMAVHRRLHDAVATTGTRPEDRLRVAVWGLEGGAPVDRSLLLDAARASHHAHDGLLAVRLCEAAIRAGAGTPAQQLLGEILAGLGRHDEAEAVLRTAGREATTDRDRSTVALTLSTLLYWGLDRPDDACDVLVAAEGRVEDPAWRDEMAAERATFAVLSGRLLDALDIAQPIARAATGRPFVQACIAAVPALAIAGRSDEALALATRGFDAHVALGDVEIMSDPGIHLVGRCLARAERGDLVTATGEARDGYGAAVSVGAVEGEAWFALILGRALLLRRPADADQWFRTAKACFAEMGQPGPQRWCLAGVALARAALGDGHGAEQALVEELTLGGRHIRVVESDVVRARAWAAAARGDLDRAERALLDAAETARESGAPGLEVAALHDLVRLGRVRRATDRLVELATVVDGDLVQARVAHAHAVLAHDAEGLGDCADRFGILGADVLAAEAAAGACRAHHRDGSRRAAQRWAREARRLAGDAGGVDTPATDLGAGSTGLTPRELEVARLAASGQTNRQIAAGLGLSIRTVGNHLQRAYDKLGVTGRDDLVGRVDDRLSTPDSGHGDRSVVG